MDTLVRVQIVCRLADLRDYSAFTKAAEFNTYDADIDITCTDTKQTKMYRCSAAQINCYGWQYFRTEWERQFGKLNP